MVDMKNSSAITIWKGCDVSVADAIQQLLDCWEPYSAASKRYPIARLVKELIDPAVAAYTATVPAHYQKYVPGAGTGVALSEIMQLVGAEAMVRVQRRLLKAFVLTENLQSDNDQQFIATLETLIELVWACKRKQPAKRNAHGLNGQRLKVFCRFCGNPAELASFIESDNNGNLRGLDEQLRLSNLYCTAHRPKLPSNEWNPEYRKAKRSVAQFDLELIRLSRQSASRATPQAGSGDHFIDSYIHHYILGQTLTLADEAELRNLARLMVDSKLSDRKKQILMLQRLGFNQSAIARKLGITRQAASKAVASIPKIFRLS